MFKMLRLDWFALKCCRIKFLFIGISLLAMGWFSTIFLVPLGVFQMFSLSINAFAVEEKGDLNKLYLTLPIKRSRVVMSRYLLSLVLFLAGMALALILMPLLNLVSFSKWYPDIKWSLALISFGFFLHALMSLCMYPVLFKLGYQKGKVWGFYVPTLLISAALVAVMEYDFVAGTFILNLLVYASEHILFVSGGIFALGAAMLAVSCLLSMKIYTRREF